MSSWERGRPARSESAQDGRAPREPPWEALPNIQSDACAHRPAFTGLFSMYSTALAKCPSSLIARSKYSSSQNAPSLPSRRLASFAVKDFQECTMDDRLVPWRGVANTWTWLGITTQACRQ